MDVQLVVVRKGSDFDNKSLYSIFSFKIQKKSLDRGIKTLYYRGTKRGFSLFTN